jgi:hydrogenase maturation protease
VARVRVIGCGNPDAGDDAAGLVVLDRLARALPDGVELAEAGPATRVLDLLDDVETVVVIDAVRSPDGARPAGTLVRAEGGADGLGAELRGSLSSHGLGLAEAVGLAAALGSSPRILFHGVEVADVSIGAPLSGPVASALPALVDAVLLDVRGAIAA